MKKLFLLLFFIGFTNNIHAEVIPSIEKIFKEKVKTITEGDNIQLKGFFETEIGETAFFSIQSVIEQ